MSAVILGTVAAGLALIGRWDRAIRPGRKGWAAICAASAVGNALLRFKFGQENPRVRLLLSLFLGCLLLACVTDVATREVHNFVWWIAGTAAALLLYPAAYGSGAGRGSLWELLLFCVIQLVLFARLYGRADCYAFCVCAVAETGLGMGMTGFLLHMLTAFLLLSAVQAVRGNIAMDGRLREPVAFLPYITAGAYIMLFF